MLFVEVICPLGHCLEKVSKVLFSASKTLQFPVIKPLNFFCNCATFLRTRTSTPEIKHRISESQQNYKKFY